MFLSLIAQKLLAEWIPTTVQVGAYDLSGIALSKDIIGP